MIIISSLGHTFFFSFEYIRGIDFKDVSDSLSKESLLFFMFSIGEKNIFFF